MPSKRPHHHGNLRAALVEAGLALVGQDGPSSLTIRGVAAAVGVSHAAPAHHFASLAELRGAVAAEGHRRFAAAMEAAIAAEPATPRGAAIGACIGYLRFARAYPGLFELMFGSAGAAASAELAAAGKASYAVLARVARGLSPDPARAADAELTIWALAHGYAALAVQGHPALAEPAAAEARLRRIFPRLDPV